MIGFVAATSAMLFLLPGHHREAGADTDPPAGVPATVSADELPTPQVDGIVRSTVIVGNTVYAVGKFTKARPFGVAPGGAGEVTRTNILAYDLTTGELLPFDHTITGTAYTSTTNPGKDCDSVGTNQWLCESVFRIEKSPDNSRVYIGGDFTHVDGERRGRAAAFEVATGDLVADFKPSFNSRVRAITFGGSGVYFGGDFTSVTGSSGGVAARTRLAVLYANGEVVPNWAPSADKTVYALGTSADRSRIIVGGNFDHLNATAIHGLGAVSRINGATVSWSSRPIQKATATSTPHSYVTDMEVEGDTVYVVAHGSGGKPVFEGRLAADPMTGNLRWKDNCYGATQGVTVHGGVVYSASHAHDCSDIGGWPQTRPPTFARLLAETTTVRPQNDGKPLLLHWFPTVNQGPTTGFMQGPWAVDADGTYVVVGGEFTRVNGRAQQGLTRFAVAAVAPNSSGPLPFSVTATRIMSGTIRVAWNRTWDKDNTSLRYQLMRTTNGVEVEVMQWVRTSNFWTMPGMAHIDSGLAPGRARRYRVIATDPRGNQISSPYAYAFS